jgi:hypothetical protein
MDAFLAITDPIVAASNAAFFTLFGIFVVATFVLSFITVRWAIRRDRVGRAAWRERQQGGGPANPTQ